MSIDPRLMERRKSVAEDNAKKSVSRVLKFLIFVMVVAAVVWVAFSPWLSVSQVTTEGIEVSEAHSILVDHGVMAGTPMILVNASSVEQALLDDPWVSDAEVALGWPDEITVEIVERVPVAWVATEEGWARRDLTGVAVPSDPEPPAEAPRIDLPGLSEAAAPGDPDLLGALQFVATLDRRHHPGLVITRRDGELWAVVSGYETRLGRAVDMAEKALSLGALLQEDIPPDATLNLIAPTLPGWTSPSQEGEAVSEEEGEGSDDGDEGNDEDS